MMAQENITNQKDKMFSIDSLILSIKQNHFEDSSEFISYDGHYFANPDVNHNSFLLGHSLDSNIGLSQIEMKNALIDSNEYVSLILDNQQIKEDRKKLQKNRKTDDEIDILRKYFTAWFDLSKNDGFRTERLLRQEKINDFLNNILKKKNELNEKKKINGKSKGSDNTSESSSARGDDTKKTQRAHFSTYQNRYQAQKHIIALQKAKLEQQERVIEQLKLNKIVEDASMSNEIMSDIKKTLEKCDRTIKPKLKCIIREIDPCETLEETLTLNCTRVPRFLQKMEQRAREREEKRAVVQERRRQMELEREKMKEQMEITRQLMDQEEKNKRLNEFKEKRRQEQLIAIRKRELRERMRALTVMADLYYEKKLVAKFGLNAWKMFIVKNKADYETAVIHDKQKFIKNHFIAWKSYTADIISKRHQIADDMYKQKVCGWVYQEWKLTYRVMVNKRQVAEDWYDLHIIERIFHQWKMNIVKVRYQRQRQWDLAVQHYNDHLKWRVVGSWQMLPTINTLEREHEARKQRWRLKVQQVLPDFIPRNDDE